MLSWLGGGGGGRGERWGGRGVMPYCHPIVPTPCYLKARLSIKVEEIAAL